MTDNATTGSRAPAPDALLERQGGLQRQLSARQMAMMALGGAIGTGLFLGSGLSVQLAGPGVILSYAFGTLISLALMWALAEMAVAHPVAGSLGVYAEMYVHPWAGFTLRYAYWLAQAVAREIEKQGYRALPFPASQLVDWQNQKGHISHKRVAEIAGIGWIGRNNLLVHPDYGSQMRYNTVFTDMPLDPTSPSEEFGCGPCRACVSVCPAGAITDEAGNFDHHACFAMLKRFRNERNVGQYICGLCVKACKGKR